MTLSINSCLRWQTNDARQVDWIPQSILFQPDIMQNSRYQPHLNSHYIPAGAQAPVRPNASSRNYSFEVVPPPAYREPPVNPWDEVLSPSSVSPTTPTLRPRAQSSHTATAQRPHLSPVQASATTNGIFTFPEPQIYQPSTSRPMLFQQPPTGHRYSRSDLDASSASLRSPSVASLTSTTSSYGAYDDRYATSSSEVCRLSISPFFRTQMVLLLVLLLRKT